MPPRDPNKVQLDFPLLTADLIAQLSLTGALGVLDFSPTVVPVFLVGSRGLVVTSTPIEYLQSEIFDGALSDWAANAILLDTGPLAAGTYDIRLWMTIAQTAGANTIGSLEHRDAANAVSLSSWHITNNNGTANAADGEFATNVNLNERFRIRGQVATTGRMGGTLAIKRRVVP